MTDVQQQLYGVRTENQPKSAGCPASGWIHEPHPPWRVIVSADPGRLPLTNGVTPYDGNEATVDVEVWRTESIESAERTREMHENTSPSDRTHVHLWNGEGERCCTE